MKGKFVILFLIRCCTGFDLGVSLYFYFILSVPAAGTLSKIMNYAPVCSRGTYITAVLLSSRGVRQRDFVLFQYTNVL